MKTKIFTQIFLIVFLSSLGGVMAQNKTEKTIKEETNKDGKKETSIIVDGKKLTGEELEKELAKVRQHQELVFKNQQQEQMKIQKEAMESYKQSLEELKEKGVEGFVALPRPDRWTNSGYMIADNYNIWSMKQNNSLIISKDLADVTNATDFTYEVKEDTYNISFSVNGTLNAGEMTIIFKNPQGKNFQELTISPLADINWNQEFEWNEDNQDEYLGKWMVSIKAANAKGKYNVRVNSR
ncbi:MAG: hypothetical protein V2A67_03560 [Bacteroidota bacterium]